jgi:hypothetical protein
MAYILEEEEEEIRTLCYLLLLLLLLLYSRLLDLGCFFSFLILYAVGRAP